MQAKSWLCFWAVIAVVSLVACSPAATAAPISTQTGLPSLTASPTSSPVTITSTPLLTATLALATSVPILSATPVGPTPVEILPVMTRHTSYYDVTSIATPEFDADSYQLKDVSEANLLELIRLLELYAHENDSEQAARSRAEFEQNQTLVELAIQEMQFRFPTSRYQELLDWHLATARAVQGESESDGWVLSTIEAGLNRKRFLPDDLNAGLMPYGFFVAEQLSVKDLLERGKDARIYRVQSRDTYGSRGIIFAITGKEPGHYKLIPIHSNWSYGVSTRPIEARDVNQNSIVEVIVELMASSGSMCISKVLIFEWDGNRFVDLSHDKIGSSDCLGWSFGESNTAEAATLSIENMNKTENFKWNGTYYALNDWRFKINGPFVVCTEYANFLTAWDDYQRGIQYLQAVLDTWPDENIKAFGESCPDYLRFQIGLAYAYHGRSAEAQSVLRTLASAPKLSAATKAFLATYHDKNDLYQSCHAAQQIVDQLYAEDEKKQTDKTTHLDSWWDYYTDISLCDRDIVFPLLIKSFGNAEISDPLVALQKNGLDTQNAHHLDLDGDGVLDWLVDINQQTGAMDIWGLLTAQQGLQPIHITDLYDYQASDQKDFKMDTFPVPASQNLFLVLWFSDYFEIHRVQQTATGSPATLAVFRDYYIGQYAFQQTDHALDLEMSSDYYLGFNRWNSLKNQFELLPLYDNDIFTGGGPAEALPYLKRITDKMENVVDAPEKPRFLYLLALAYDLTGDKSQATKIYWQVWHDFPENRYATMAQSKIEKRAP